MATLKLTKAAGHIIEFLPPYSPDLNPIEKFWANFKRGVREILNTCSSLAEAIDKSFLSFCKT